MFNVSDIIQAGGLLAVGLIIFAESGLLLGFFLPGDTLLLTAGLFAGQGRLPLGWLLFTVILSAVIGYQVGYGIGQRIGPKLFKRQSGILFREDYIARTRDFLEKYGAGPVHRPCPDFHISDRRRRPDEPAGLFDIQHHRRRLVGRRRYLDWLCAGQPGTEYRPLLLPGHRDLTDTHIYDHVMGAGQEFTAAKGPG
jgi:hypothetical protein